jgi:hypothetical protein
MSSVRIATRLPKGTTCWALGLLGSWKVQKYLLSGFDLLQTQTDYLSFDRTAVLGLFRIHTLHTYYD